MRGLGKRYFKKFLRHDIMWEISKQEQKRKKDKRSEQYSMAKNRTEKDIFEIDNGQLIIKGKGCFIPILIISIIIIAIIINFIIFLTTN